MLEIIGMISTRGRGRLPTTAPARNAAAAGEHHRDCDLIEGHGQCVAVLAGVRSSPR